MTKYEINENKSCEVSNHRFFVVPIPFWDPFITSDGPGGRVPIPFWDPFLISDDYGGLDLQILMTSGGLSMKKKMLMGHFIYHCFSESNPKHIFESEGPKCLWSPEVKIQNHWTWIMLGIKFLVFYCSSLSSFWGAFLTLNEYKIHWHQGGYDLRLWKPKKVMLCI